MTITKTAADGAVTTYEVDVEARAAALRALDAAFIGSSWDDEAFAAWTARYEAIEAATQRVAA